MLVLVWIISCRWICWPDFSAPLPLCYLSSRDTTAQGLNQNEWINFWRYRAVTRYAQAKTGDALSQNRKPKSLLYHVWILGGTSFEVILTNLNFKSSKKSINQILFSNRPQNIHLFSLMAYSFQTRIIFADLSHETINTTSKQNTRTAEIIRIWT